MAVKPTIAVEMQFSGSGGAWTDVSGDVLVTNPIVAKYGIQAGGPLDRTAAVGTLDLALNNAQDNSGGLLGYYSPNHANLRSGFAVGIGTRLKITYGGSTFYKWRGQVEDIEPSAGQFRERRVRTRCEDFMGTAGKWKMRLQDVQFDKTADQAIASILGDMSNPPSASTLATGQDTFATVFDSVRDERTTALSELQRLVVSESGFAYMRGDQLAGGHFEFEDRHSRPKFGAATASFNDTMLEMRAVRSRSLVYNRVKIHGHPRETGAAASILFTLQNKPLVQPSACLIIEGRYSDPNQRGTLRVGGASMVTPTSTTDYTMNSASDGTGTDLTDKFTVVASFGGNSVRISACNFGTAAAYVTLLQARGRMIAVREPTTSEKTDQTSINSFGESVLEYDMPYQDSPLVTDDAANATLTNWKDPATHIDSVSFLANESDTLMTQMLQREPGDKITITETATGIDKDFFIQGVELAISAPDLLRCTWNVAPAETTQYWILGTVRSSELGITTIPGY